jgi:hypothetical protein
MFILVILSVVLLAGGIRPHDEFLPFFGFPKSHFGAQVLAVALCPAAHAPEWTDDCLSQLRQRVLDSNGFRLRHAPRD